MLPGGSVFTGPWLAHGRSLSRNLHGLLVVEDQFQYESRSRARRWQVCLKGLFSLKVARLNYRQ